MSNQIAHRIESWFAQHDGDGEFTCHQAERAYTVIGRTSADCRIIYTTKPQCLYRAFERLGANRRLALIGRYGLPDYSDLQWIQSLINGRKVVFVGDSDPPDLLVFLWLKANIQIEYLGVCDAFLNRLGVTQEQVMSLPLSASEVAAIPLLAEISPDFRALLGPRCASRLDAGCKCELEGAVNFATVKPAGWFET